MIFQRFGLINAILPIVFLGSAASFQLVACTLYLNNKPDLVLILLSFLVTSGIYLLNRIIDNEDKFNNLPRWQFFNGTTFRAYFWIFISFIALVAPTFFYLLNQQTNISMIFMLISITGILYSVKILPFFKKNRLNWVCFKEIPVVKSLIVCFIWGLGALLLAIADGNVNPFRVDILFILTILFISSLNSTITSDVRDITGDRMRKIYTIPVLIGSDSTFKLLILINIGAILMSAILTFKGIIALKLFYFGCLITLWAALSTLPQYFNMKILSKTSMELLVDSESVVCAIGLVIISKIN